VLLEKLLENNFDALITFDKNLQHQQNFTNIKHFLLVAARQSFNCYSS